MIVKHDLDIYQTLNKFTYKNEKILFGFAWSKFKVKETQTILEE